MYLGISSIEIFGLIKLQQ